VEEAVEGVGRGIKRGVNDVSDAVRRRFDAVRADVNRMETHSRVYSRLRWDRALANSKIEVHVFKDGTALLMGHVPDPEARKRAIELTRETVGITSVIDDLTPPVSVGARRPSGSRTPR
jgi:osmotically-inducible protein OsmY